MNGRIILILLLLNYTLFCFSCKKDEDSSPPEIIVINPDANTSFHSLDTILVSAKIKDDKELTSVVVELLDADLVSVVSSWGKSLSTPSYNLNAGLVIDNFHLNTGKHYLRITAKDSRNTTRSFTELYVYGLPYETKGYVSFENQNGQGKAFNYFYNSDSILFSVDGSIIGGTVDNYNQHIGFLKDPSGPFESYALTPFNEDWEVAGVQGGITFCRSQRDKIYTQLGFVQQLTSFYQGNGLVQRNFNSEDQYKPLLSLDHGSDVVVWQKAPGQGSDRLEVFFPSGALKQVTNYNKSVVGLEEKDNEWVYVISNGSSDGFLDEYNTESGIIVSYTVEGAAFIDACVDASENVYISSEQGIYKYNASLLSIALISSIEGEQIAWDVNNEVLIVSTENSLIILDELGNELNSFPTNGSSLELSVWYSK